MRTTCPACGAAMSLDVLLNHDEARAAVSAALQLPAPLAAQLLRYLTLFRPAQRSLTMDRLAKLLTELLPLIQTARIERNGRVYGAPLETWKHALDEMFTKRERLTLPLKSHGYLLEIIAGLAEKSEAAGERQAENARRYAYSQTRATSGPVSLAEAAQAAVSAPQAVDVKRPIPQAVRADLARYALRKPTDEETADGDQG